MNLMTCCNVCCWCYTVFGSLLNSSRVNLDCEPNPCLRKLKVPLIPIFEVSLYRFISCLQFPLITSERFNLLLFWFDNFNFVVLANVSSFSRQLISKSCRRRIKQQSEHRGTVSSERAGCISLVLRQELKGERIYRVNMSLMSALYSVCSAALKWPKDQLIRFNET